MKKLLGILLGVLILIGLYVGYRYYKDIFRDNISLNEEFILLIPTGGDFSAVMDTLREHDVLINEKSFKWLAERKNYLNNVKSGRFLIKPDFNNNELINLLRSGRQEPLNLTLHDISGVYELAGKLGSRLEQDSLSFLKFLKNEENLKKYNLDPHTITAIFLPNTYEVYWTTTPGQILNRMNREFETFWNRGNRRIKAEDMNLTPVEIITLASIVERETVKKDEQARVAGLYINRLRRGMKLQSDPTAVYGINLDYPDRRITRVYYKDLEYDSPYNTYLYPGLPPGPIRIPSLHAIDAVLNYEQHDYIFMVADPDRPGYHRFARNYREHLANDRIYKRSLR